MKIYRNERSYMTKMAATPYNGKNHLKTSYCSYARSAQPGPIRCLGPLRSDSVIKLVSVLFGKYTTLVVTKC